MAGEGISRIVRFGFAGPGGATGPTGPAGPAGPSGTANVADFGATGLPSQNATSAVEDALEFALQNDGDPQYPTYRSLFFPSGAYNISRPIRIPVSNFVLQGEGALSILRPGFQGPSIIIGPDMSDNPQVTSGGPFGGRCFNPGGDPENYLIEMSRLGCGKFSGLTAFTVEMWVKVTEVVEDGDIAVITLSIGKEIDSQVGFDTAMIFHLVSGVDYGGGDNIPLFRVKIGSTTYEVKDNGTSLPMNTWVHIAAKYNGSTVKLLVDGDVVASTAASGTVTQKIWETVTLGYGFGGLIQDQPFGAFPGQIGPVRFSSQDNYPGVTTTYTIPDAPFPVSPPDGPPLESTFLDFFVTDWAITYAGDVEYASSNGRPVWIGNMGSRDLLESLSYVTIKDIQIYANNGAEAGGIQTRMTVGCIYDNVQTKQTRFACISENNSYASRWVHCSHLGSGAGVAGFPGFIILTTAGDKMDFCKSELCTYSFVLSGGISLDTCTSISYNDDGAGIYSRNGFLQLSNIFFDSEMQVGSGGRGNMLLSNTIIQADGMGFAGSFVPGSDQPAATFDACYGRISGNVATLDSNTFAFKTITPPPEISGIQQKLEFDVTHALFETTACPLLNDVKGYITVRSKESNGIISIPISGNTTLTMDQWTNRNIQFTGSTAAMVTVPSLAGWCRGLHNLGTGVLSIVADGGLGFDLFPGDRQETFSDGDNIYPGNLGGQWRVRTGAGATLVDGRADSHKLTLNTTDDTPTEIFRIPLYDDAVNRFDCVISGKSGANSYTRLVSKVANMVSGTPTAATDGPSDPDPYTTGTVSGWDFSVDVDGTDMVGTATGVAATTIKWDVMVDRKKVG